MSRLAVAAATTGLALAFASALTLSVTFEDGAPELLVDQALAEVPASTTCAPTCDRLYEACVKGATAQAKVGACYRCCKETESKGRVGTDEHPSHEELEEHMFDACVTNLDAFGHPEWFSEGFPRSYAQAKAYTPKRGGLAEELQKKYGAKGPSSSGEDPSRADESACIKGCSHRPRAAMKACTVAYTSCRRACAPSGAKCPPK